MPYIIGYTHAQCRSIGHQSREGEEMKREETLKPKKRKEEKEEEDGGEEKRKRREEMRKRKRRDRKGKERNGMGDIKREWERDREEKGKGLPPPPTLEVNAFVSKVLNKYLLSHIYSSCVPPLRSSSG